MSATAVEVSQEFVHLLVTLVDGLQAARDDATVVVSFQPHSLHDDPKGVDVVAHVGHGVLQLFRCHILHGACRLLQDGMTIGVGEAEVDDFHIVAIMGNHDIRGLQVAVHHLLRMDIGDTLGDFAKDALPLLLRGVFVEVGCQSASVNPLGDDTKCGASFGQRYLLDSHHLHDGRVLQRHCNLKFLSEHLLIDGKGCLFFL